MSGLPERVLLGAPTETLCAWASAKQLSHVFAVRLASESLLQGSALGIHKCPGDPQVLQHMMQSMLKQGDLRQLSQLQAPFSRSQARMTAAQ